MKKKKTRSKQRSRQPEAARQRVRVARRNNGSTFGICLVGFMGAGKSSVGRALSERLRCDFEDLDDRIERREGRRIAEIFRVSGEPAFRQAESAALAEVLEEMRDAAAKRKILALGGGAFAVKWNAAALKSAGLPVIFLDAPVKELWRRCCRQAEEAGTERPLLRSAEEFRKLYRARRSSYRQASQIIDTSGRTVKAIANEIAETISENKKNAIKEKFGEV